MDASTIGFILGIVILIGIIYFALITPALCEGILRSFIGSSSALIPNGSTEFKIAGVTYDTRDIVTELFNRTY
jgi:hypothetical protein